MNRNLNNKGIAKSVVVIGIVILVIASIAAVWAFLLPGNVTRDKAVEKYFKAVSEEDIKLYKNTCYTKKWHCKSVTKIMQEVRN